MSEEKETLTPIEEAFALQIALGKSQAEALRLAHPRAKHWKPASVHVEACLVMGKAKVRRRVKALQAEFIEQSMWARHLSIEALKEVIETPDRKSDVVAAVRELNAMHGFHEAQRVEHSGSITSIERRIVDVTPADANVLDSNVPGVSSKRSQVS
ncbi:MAG: hypothetical protein EBW14_16240 [Oxalobacteraceae bacterium]|nr:hypothetical protein [Oxalobacteraceae bacterium]